VTRLVVPVQVSTKANFRDDNPWFVFSRDGRLVRAGRAARRSRP